MYTDKIDKQRVQKTKRSKKVDINVTTEEMEKNIESAIDILDEDIDQSRESTSTVSQNHQNNELFNKQSNLNTVLTRNFLKRCDKKPHEIEQINFKIFYVWYFPKKMIVYFYFSSFLPLCLTENVKPNFHNFSQRLAIISGR